ncbi:MAG: hypothetical protein HC828_06060 [Blastochloris sp.]|nr:hypothetical protein [Blastochloris sp.]
MTTIRETVKAIWHEAYVEHTQRQHDAIRADVEDIAQRRVHDHDDVFVDLDAQFVFADVVDEPDWTDAQWKAFCHGMDTQRYRETLTAILADFPAAQRFDTADLKLAITPTCVFALYVAARRSANVEAFIRISDEMAHIFGYRV